MVIHFSRYSIMMTCWSPNPNERPTFKEIVKILSGYTETLAGYLDMNSNPFISSCEFQRDGDRPSEGLMVPNKLTALYYNVTSKLRGRSRSPKSKSKSPKSSPRASPRISPQVSPRISPRPEPACNAKDDVPSTPVIKIDSPE